MIKIASVLTLLLLSLASTVASADASATLHIGSGYGTTCATGGCPIYGSEVNNINNSVLDIYQTSAGAPALSSPVLLILGVANTTSASSAIENSVLNASLIDTSGHSTAVSTAFDKYQGTMTSSNVYSFLELSGANKSNSFTNWRDAALAVDGIHATNFGIYVFSLKTSGFAGNDYLNIHTNLLPEGTFAVAYGTSDGKAYSTPFTNAGMRDTPPRAVPEPMPLVLICLGLFGIAYLTKRKIA